MSGHAVLEGRVQAGHVLATVSAPNAVCACVLVIQSCPTLCNPVDCSTPFSVHGVLQASILEWAAIPSPRNPPHPGTEPRSPALQADSLPSEPPGKYTTLWDYPK